MMQATRDNSGGISEALKRDLAMVLPEVRAAGAEHAEAQAFVGGKQASVDEAVARASALLRGSAAPAVVGLNGLTIEGVREAVALVERLRAKLLPMPLGDPLSARLSVTQTATLGHALSADLRVVLQEGMKRPSNPIGTLIAERVPNALFMPGDLESLLRLRTKLREQGAAAITSATALPVKHVVVPLPAGTDPRIVSQWHKLAAELQRALRVSVLSLPDLSHSANIRGALEVITWQTGLSCASGGVDFAEGAPRPCAGATTLLERGGVDVEIDCGHDPLPPGLAERCAHRIRIGVEADLTAAVSFITPGLTARLRGRVMRFDGVILWLCDDPSRAGPAVDDAAPVILKQLCSAVG